MSFIMIVVVVVRWVTEGGAVSVSVPWEMSVR